MSQHSVFICWCCVRVYVDDCTVCVCVRAWFDLYLFGWLGDLTSASLQHPAQIPQLTHPSCPTPQTYTPKTWLAICPVFLWLCMWVGWLLRWVPNQLLLTTYEVSPTWEGAIAGHAGGYLTVPWDSWMPLGLSVWFRPPRPHRETPPCQHASVGMPPFVPFGGGVGRYGGGGWRSPRLCLIRRPIYMRPKHQWCCVHIALQQRYFHFAISFRERSRVFHVTHVTRPPGPIRRHGLCWAEQKETRGGGFPFAIFNLLHNVESGHLLRYLALHKGKLFLLNGDKI